MARVTIKVHPRAKRSAVTGRFGETCRPSTPKTGLPGTPIWKLDLAAPPVDGKANEECVRFLAELVGVARSRVRIVAGATGRMKTLEITEFAQEELERLLDAG